jgi:hypothetical protein
MTWNHRVFAQPDGNDGDVWYTIREAYYEDGKDRPNIWSMQADGVGGNSIAEMRDTLQRMLRALDTPILELENAGKEGERLK